MRNISGLFLSTLCIALLASRAQAEEPAPEPTDTGASCEDAGTKADFHKCFDKLKADMLLLQPTADRTEFLCTEPDKERFDCVIKALNKCPKYAEERAVMEFKNLKSGLTVKDLLYVTSADEFCKCAPTNTCLNEIDTNRLGEDLKDSPWNKTANMVYICGHGRKNIECVANSLPACTRYLQYKYNKTMQSSMAEYYDVGGLEWASTFAEAHCKSWPNEKINDSCPQKRSKWLSVEVCYEYALNYKDINDRQCGLRKCVEKAMDSCPKGTMDFFIDSVNVFGNYKITRTPCTVTSSSSTVLATLTSLLLAIYVSLFL